MDNPFFSVGKVWVESVVRDHLKGLSPTQQQQAIDYLMNNKQELHIGFDDGLRAILDDWVVKQNKKLTP